MLGLEYAHDVADVAANVARVRERVATAARRSGRRPDEVTLVAVTKGVDLPRIQAAIACGISELGESRVQEAVPKVQSLASAVPQLRWHLVGHLQRNKVRQALAIFGVIHSVDSGRLALELDHRARDVRGGQPALDVLVQVNVADEPQKYGVPSEAVDGLMRVVAELPHLRPVGLMTIAPQVTDPEDARSVFRRLRELREEINTARIVTEPLAHLSMGMSDDFEVAVEEGATMVRIGRAIFGERL